MIKITDHRLAVAIDAAIEGRWRAADDILRDIAPKTSLVTRMDALNTALRRRGYGWPTILGTLPREGLCPILRVDR
jgi:hypothetical protein